MKLAPLLAQFLYSHKRLDLAGIGSFFLDPSFSIDNEIVAQQKSISPDAISFESNPSVKDSTDLITFISSQTGKMKALAEADLGSHLELAKQFLNIGKPFMLDGIGSLVKVRSGQFEFKAGAILAEKLKDFSEKDSHEASPEESFKNYEPFLKREKTSTGWAKPVLALLVLVGIGLAVLGGYMIYKKNNPSALAAQDETVATRE
ncbi:MAG TPA: hypothetical protein VFO70_10615, partial [Chitinophagaceae bacterium]|nr:hypothetical protein [Chitinophagaceae bacterium]